VIVWQGAGVRACDAAGNPLKATTEAKALMRTVRLIVAGIFISPWRRMFATKCRKSKRDVRSIYGNKGLIVLILVGS
jgi:hypothetical protein